MEFSAVKLSDLDLIQDEIYRKLIRISRGEDHFTSKYFHIPFIKQSVLRIHSRVHSLLKNPNYLLTEDKLAHQISFFGKDFPEAFFQSVKHIILIPEFIKTPEYFLTHIYEPEKKILAFYMYPSRMQLDLNTFQENRITGKKIITPGLFHITARTISNLQRQRSHQNLKAEPHSHKMHKFIHPVSSLSHQEIKEMTDLSDACSHADFAGEFTA
ncbi:MAG: hypothetical protein OEZ34_14520 [Spirochaetia bacterium]|nr:hypothetical protein [Spirochaetia bacterium]